MAVESLLMTGGSHKGFSTFSWHLKMGAGELITGGWQVQPRGAHPAHSAGIFPILNFLSYPSGLALSNNTSLQQTYAPPLCRFSPYFVYLQLHYTFLIMGTNSRPYYGHSRSRSVPVITSLRGLDGR